MTNPNRTPAGVPTGGQFAASARTEADVDLFDLHREAQAGALAARLAAEKQEALARRIEAYSVLADFPDDHSVATLDWAEDPNEDGTFDVNLDAVYNADGEQVADLGGMGGALPAGHTEGFRDYTDFDDWRTDPTSIHSPISVAKAKAWFAAHTAQREQGAETHSPEYTRASNEIGLTFESLKSRPVGPNGMSRTVDGTDVGVSLYSVRDSDGMPKPRGTVGDVTLTGHGKHHTFPFGQPSDPDNYETFEDAQAAAAATLVQWNG